jgi:hypothetical protein
VIFSSILLASMEKRTIALVDSPKMVESAKKIKISLSPMKMNGGAFENNGNLLNAAIRDFDIDDDWLDDEEDAYIQEILAVRQAKYFYFNNCAIFYFTASGRNTKEA